MPTPAIGNRYRFVNPSEFLGIPDWRPWGECGYVALLAYWLKYQWAKARDNEDWRIELVTAIGTVRTQPLGDAIDGFMLMDPDVGMPDGWPEYRDALNMLPRRLQVDLVDHALGALDQAMDIDIVLSYSTNGATGIEVSTWYTDGAYPPHDDVTAFRQIHIVCPALNTPGVDTPPPPISAT